MLPVVSAFFLLANAEVFSEFSDYEVAAHDMSPEHAVNATWTHLPDWLRSLFVPGAPALIQEKTLRYRADVAEIPSSFMRAAGILNNIIVGALGDLDITGRECSSKQATLEQQLEMNSRADTVASEGMGRAMSRIDAGHNAMTKGEAMVEQLRAAIEAQRANCQRDHAVREGTLQRMQGDLSAAQNVLKQSDCSAKKASAIQIVSCPAEDDRPAFLEVRTAHRALAATNLSTPHAQLALSVALRGSGRTPPSAKSFLQMGSRRSSGDSAWAESENEDDAFEARYESFKDYYFEDLREAPVPRLEDADAQYPLSALLQEKINEGPVGTAILAAQKILPATGEIGGDRETQRAAAKRGCAISNSPTCGVFEAHVASMVGELHDTVVTNTHEQIAFEQECKSMEENLNSQLVEATEMQQQGAMDLAGGQADRSKRMEELEQLRILRRSLSATLAKSKESCKSSKDEMVSRLCGAKKLKKELEVIMKVKTTQATVDCQVSAWIPGMCTASCGGGTRLLTRRVLMEASPPGLGAPCPPLKMEERCNEHPCPVDCLLGEWEGWGSCSKSCDGGTQERNREVLRHAENDGAACGDTIQTRMCNEMACDRDCTLSDWTQWRSCTQACGGGMQWRRKEVERPATGQRKCYKAHAAQRLNVLPCNTQGCPDDIKCDTATDVVFVVSGSGTVGNAGIAAQKAFLQNLTSAMSLGADKAMVAVVLADKTTTTLTPLTASSAELSTAIGKVDSSTANLGGSNLGAALATARNLLRTGRRSAASVVFVITDAVPGAGGYSEILPEVRDTKRIARIMVTVLPTTEGAMQRARSWSSWPHQQNFVVLTKLATLTSKSHVTATVASLCPVVRMKQLAAVKSTATIFTKPDSPQDQAVGAEVMAPGTAGQALEQPDPMHAWAAAHGITPLESDSGDGEQDGAAGGTNDPAQTAAAEQQAVWEVPNSGFSQGDGGLAEEVSAADQGGVDPVSAPLAWGTPGSIAAVGGGRARVAWEAG
mmetsp:Transcript_19958/g.48613  ORF Transcript_19958/g.48613 Transcript_19958/m.48613 type:complete len:999 (-) Transcript_19958:322-3318(-)